MSDAYVRLIKVFVASPSEMSIEREIVSEVQDELNTLVGTRQNYRVEVLKWETHSRPGAGPEPQAIVNQTVGTDYDVMVGIIGNRFGTATSSAGSGTEEEFDIAYSKYSEGQKPEILFYFRNHKTAPGEIFADEIAKISAFKEALKGKGVAYWDYETPDEFKRNLLRHLEKVCSEILTASRLPSPGQQRSKFGEPAPAALDPLHNLNSLNSSFDSGIMELIESAEIEFEVFTECSERLTDGVSALGQAMSKDADNLKSFNLSQSPPTRVQVKRATQGTSRHMERYTKIVADTLPEMHEAFGQGIDRYHKAYLLSKEDNILSDEEREGIEDSITQLRSSLETTLEQLASFQGAIQDMPRMNSEISRARRRLLAVNTDIQSFFIRAISQLQELEKDFVQVNE